MSKSILPTALLSLGLAALVFGQAPPTFSPTTPATSSAAAGQGVEHLIDQLGDSDYRKRDEAARLLEAEGVKVVPALRKALGHPDAEVRRRAQELIPVLETTAILAPRRVTLNMVDRPLRDVFAEITRQTSYPVDFWASDPQKVYSFDFKDLPFWEAIDRIGRQAGLAVQQGYGDERVRLQEQGYARYVSHDGAFRFTANSFQHYRHVDFGLAGRGTPAQRSETLTFQFTVFSEPKLPLLGIGEPKLTAAYDSEKNSMLPLGNVSTEVPDSPWGFRGRWYSRFGNGNRALSMPTQVNLNRPSERATGVKVLRGTLPVTLLAEQKPVVVTDNVLKAKGKRAKVGTTNFFFEDVSQLPTKQYQVKLTITEENKDNPNDYTWMNSLYQRIELQDDKGNKYQVWGSSWGNSGPNHVQLTLTYGRSGLGKIGPPSKFVFHSWTILQHQVAFEFRDLPLP